MGAARIIALGVTLALAAACEQDQSDQNIAIDNNLANADIEALPPDESSATPTDQLENGIDAPVTNDTVNTTNSY